jgi:hypothetical protein
VKKMAGGPDNGEPPEYDSWTLEELDDFPCIGQVPLRIVTRLLEGDRRAWELGRKIEMMRGEMAEEVLRQVETTTSKEVVEE